jgi:UPF0755 protein
MLKKLIAALLVLIIAACAGGYFWLSSAINKPHTFTTAENQFTVEPGSGTASSLAKLARAGIIQSELPVSLWMKVMARGQSFKSGTYEFKSPITPLEVIRKLTRGEVITHSVTIPEGFNQWDIAARLAAPLAGMKQPAPASPDEMLQLFKRKVSLISDIDSQAMDLEGYLFPDTYEYTASTTREQLVEMMVKRFRKVWTPELQMKANAMGMTTRQAITMASLIEKEARVDSERETISQVYHKRWKMGEKLACDPTVIYAALLVGKYGDKVINRSDLDRDSPYNTYKLPGLPPGPIASVGKRSIEAAVNPAQSNYLYFVVDAQKRDGSHKFSESSADHERAVATYRQWEREQKAQ